MALSSNLKQNQNGGYYENGKSLPLPVRFDIVQRYLNGEKVTRIAKDLQLTHGVVSKIVRNYNKTGSWLPRNIRFAGDVNLPQPMPMPSTSADVSLHTPMPEPDVNMTDSALTEPHSNDTTTTTPTGPLPFSIQSMLSQPTPSTTSASSDSTASDESASTSSAPSPMPIKAPSIDPIPMMNPAIVGPFNPPQALFNVNVFNQMSPAQPNFVMPPLMPHPLMQTTPFIPPPQIQALQMQMSALAWNQWSNFQGPNGFC